ncbi:C40 family peptidase [Microbacterium sp. ASV81]|uniref:NlpC/P60 family protein n=1 Tax=Microbacterium capsulatum TaxID=3041921 RepID=A0ABU0XG65_9MICO|nr:NlpC/P60 family protein [Microbacterium sp. ASV81]MDQ4214118.1 NlpC/P60 family protein [Microbacterium sp. ASV81]
MPFTRRLAAACAIAALTVPVAATAAYAAHPADDPEQTRTVSIVAPPQSYTVTAAAQQPGTVRGAFVVYVPPPPPPAPAATSAATASASSSADVAAQSYSGSAVIAYAQRFVGVVPYGTGNNPNDSFSCDGLVQYVFAHFGISLPRGADHQAAMGTVISPAEARAGDLLWYPGQHIGIYDGSGGMIDSPDWGRFVEHRPIWGSPVYVRL